MASILQHRKGTRAGNDLLTGALAELSIDIDSKALRVHDGAKAGGYELGMAQANGMADLRTHTPAIGARRYLAYHTTEGDGGQGVFRALPGGHIAAQDNNGTVIVVGTNAWVREIDMFVNLRWFGAVGDGVANDTFAVREAILFCASKHTLFVPMGTYRIDTIALPETSVHILGEELGVLKPVFLQNISGNDVFNILTPLGTVHSIIFENVTIISATSPIHNNSIGLNLKKPLVGSGFGIQLINTDFDGFQVGAMLGGYFHSKIERCGVRNNFVGIYADLGINSEVINNVINCGNAVGAIGMWICSSPSIVIYAGDTQLNNAPQNAVQYRVGNDLTSPAVLGITPVQRTSSIVFDRVHFEFSDGIAAGTTQKAFVEVMTGSAASFKSCHFMNRTPNLPRAVLYSYNIRNIIFDRCAFSTGPAASGGVASYVNHVELISLNNDSFITIIPDSKKTPVKVLGASAFSNLTYQYDILLSKILNVTQPFASFANSAIAFSNGINLGGSVNTATTFIAPFDGIYNVNLTLKLGDAAAPSVIGALYRIAVYKNGGLASFVDALCSTTPSFTAQLDKYIALLSGDSIELRLVNIFSGAIIHVVANSFESTLTIKKI